MKISTNKGNPKLSDIDLTKDGKRIRKRGLTERELSQLLTELKISNYKKVGHYTWREAYLDCVKHQWCYNVSQNSANFAFRVLTDADIWLQDPNTTNVLDLYNLVSTYTDKNTGLPLKGQSRNTYIKAIRTILKKGMEFKKLKVDKFMPSFPNEEPLERDYFTDEHLLQIEEWYRKNASEEDHAYWVSLVYLGCRLIELKRLKWKDVKETTVLLTSKKGRGKDKRPKRRNIPKPDLEWFTPPADVDPDSYVFPNYNRYRLDRVWRKMKKATGLDKVKLNLVQYSARHTKLANFARKSVNVEKIKQWAGHSKIETTMVYITKEGDDLRDLA